jgi:sporulation protein YlmC with PRC-barrel domain
MEQVSELLLRIICKKRARRKEAGLPQAAGVRGVLSENPASLTPREHPFGASVASPRGARTKERNHMAMAAEQRETASLIGSDKVEGTNVYRSNGDNIGSIERIMIDKQSGKVAYAVMSFGGFLGIGHDHYPVPWSLLTYNTKLGGYEVNISEQQLKGAPSYANDNDWDWEDRKRAQQVYDYYRVPPYWM